MGSGRIRAQNVYLARTL